MLSGFEADTKKYIARRQILKFLREEVKVDVILEDFFYIGSKRA